MDAHNFNIPLKIFPNPYTQGTYIRYVLNGKSDVTVEVFNTLGEKIETLVNANQPGGEYKYRFSAGERGNSAGVYFVKLTVNGRFIIKRIVEIE